MTTSEELDLHAQELSEKLDGKVDVKILRQELDKYLNQFGIGIDAARSGILKKYSAPRTTVSASSSEVTKKISDLEGTETVVSLVAKMVYIEKKTINTKNGEKTIWSGIIGDETGTASFTLWSDEGDYQKGSVYSIKNAYCKKFKDQITVNVGTRGKVILEEGASIEVAPRSAAAPAQMMKIADITENTSSVSITGKIINVNVRKVNIKGEDRNVWGGTIADESGKIQFSAWEDYNLAEGDVYTIENAYIRSWRGIPQLNIGNSSVLTKVDSDINVCSGETIRTIEDLSRGTGGLDITIKGVIVDIKTGSGLIKRCPECRRSLMDGRCITHGDISKPALDLRLKTTIDDGTGAISAILDRGCTEQLTGISLQQAIDMTEDMGDSSIVSNAMSAKVILKRVKATGNVMNDEKFGLQTTIHSITEETIDVKSEAEKLMKCVEEELM